jgi:hypothetical protein
MNSTQRNFRNAINSGLSAKGKEFVDSMVGAHHDPDDLLCCCDDCVAKSDASLAASRNEAAERFAEETMGWTDERFNDYYQNLHGGIDL